MNLAASLTLYSSTPLPCALQMTQSVARKFFDGGPFADWKKAREAELKTQAAVVNRLNDVIRSNGIVAKTIAKTSR